LVFEIGSSLREARLRRGLDLDAVADRILIRARYLAALEEERFHLLPHGSYRRSFLREYAEFLGLDGDLYVDEYIAHHEAAEPEPLLGPGRAGRRFRVAAVVNAALVAAVASVLAAAVWGLGGSEPKRTGLSGAAATPKPRVFRPPARPRPRAAVRTAAPALTLAAARGRCWLSVRIGSSTGATVYERTLEQGQTVRFGLRKPLCIRLGAPGNVDATIGETRVSGLPVHVADVMATAAGIQPA